MSTIKVISVENGTFFARIDGKTVEVKKGMILDSNAQIISATTNSGKSKLNLELDNGEKLVIDSNTDLATLFSENSDTVLAQADQTGTWNNPTNENIDNFETAAGEDMTQDETEAGEEDAEGDGAFRGRFSDRDGDATDIISDLRDASFAEGRRGEEDEELDLLEELAEEPETPVEPEEPEPEPELEELQPEPEPEEENTPPIPVDPEPDPEEPIYPGQNFDPETKNYKIT